MNFFGIGNETHFEDYDRKYYRLRSHDYYGNLGINRNIGNSTIELGGFYKTIAIKQDSNRYINAFKNDGGSIYDLTRKHFAGADLTYKYQDIDHPIIPSKGFKFSGSAEYTYNITTPDNSFTTVQTLCDRFFFFA